jgi:uncharacterized protein
VTHDGIVIELDDAHDAAAREAAAALAREACATAGRAFAGVRPYARGAAFLREARR